MSSYPDDIRPGAIIPHAEVRVIGQADCPDFRLEQRLLLFARAMASTPHARGSSAYHGMVALSACPFPPNHPHYDEWCRGWHEAQAATLARLADYDWMGI